MFSPPCNYLHQFTALVLQIFGIYLIKDKDNVTLEDVLQPGKNMLAAGYCMYGSSCTVIKSWKASSLETII